MCLQLSSVAFTDSYEYDAFGNKINSTGSTPNNYLYRGEQYDSDLGFYYLHDRYYNPLTGRFLSMDPLASQNQKRYEYADADPVNELDPTGDEAIIEFALLQFYPGRLDIHFPTWCEAVQGTPFARYFPSCNPRHAPGGPAAPGAPGAPPHTPHHKKSPPCQKCFDTVAFAATLDRNALPKSTGNCAKFVRWALEAGGIDTAGRPNYAGYYGPFLESVGFVPVGASDPGLGYSHEQGDVTVFEPAPAHQIGHVEGYDGGNNLSGWVSDWAQRNWIPYSHPGTAGHPTIYRSKCPCQQ